MKLHLFGTCLISLVLSQGEVFAQSPNQADCSSGAIREGLSEYLKVNAQTSSGDPVQIVSIRPSNSRGLCVAKLEFSVSRETKTQPVNQLIYISSDGKYLFPSFV